LAQAVRLRTQTVSGGGQLHRVRTSTVAAMKAPCALALLAALACAAHAQEDDPEPELSSTFVQVKANGNQMFLSEDDEDDEPVDMRAMPGSSFFQVKTRKPQAISTITLDEDDEDKPMPAAALQEDAGTVGEEKKGKDAGGGQEVFRIEGEGTLMDKTGTYFAEDEEENAKRGRQELKACRDEACCKTTAGADAVCVHVDDGMDPVGCNTFGNMDNIVCFGAPGKFSKGVCRCRTGSCSNGCQ